MELYDVVRTITPSITMLLQLFCRRLAENSLRLPTEPCQDRIKRLRSSKLVYNASLPHKYYCRDTTDTEAGCQHRAVLGIDL